MGITLQLDNGLEPSYEVASYDDAFLIINETLLLGNKINKVVIA